MGTLVRSFFSINTYAAIEFGIAVLLVGGLLSIATGFRSKATLRRIPYLIFVIFTLIAATTLLLLLRIALISSPDTLWYSLSGVGVTLLGMAVFYGAVSLARSMDAFGSPFYALLAFVPGANIFLMFKKTINDVEAKRIPIFTLLAENSTLTLAVLVGFFIGALSVSVPVIISGSPDIVIQTNTPQAEESQLQRALRQTGLEQTLSNIASQAQFPIEIDAATTLSKIEAIGNNLVRTYVVKPEGFVISDEFRTTITQRNCNDAFMVQLMQAGATILDRYIKSDSSVIGSQPTSFDACQS